MSLGTTDKGFCYDGRNSSTDIAVYSRYGRLNDAPYQETAVFVLAGTNGSSQEDPRKVSLPHDGHKGRWLLSYMENCLSDPTKLSSGYHPLSLPLAATAEVITEEQYIAEKGRIASSSEVARQSMMRVQALHQESKDKKVKILKALGLSNEEVEILLS